MSKIAVSSNPSGTGTFTITSPATNTDRTLTLPDEAGTVLTDSGYVTADGTNLILKADGTNEDARIDSSGRLLVGTTATTPAATTGVRLYDDGRGFFTADGTYVGYFNRLTSDGEIIQLRKDGSTVGSIGVASSVKLYIGNDGASGTGIKFQDGNAIPCDGTGADRDNVFDFGGAVVRWDDIHATNGTIQTSDRNEKQDIEELSEAEQRVAVAAKSLMRKFRWKDKVAEKGDDARIHFGIIAQDLQAAFEAEGLDAGRYAMFISSTWWEVVETYTDDDGVEQTRTNTYDTAEEAPEGATERTRLGVRYSELLAFIIGAL